jgi:hypothetical protein
VVAGAALVAEDFPKTTEAVMAAVMEVQEMRVPADSRTSTEAPVGIIVEVTMITKEIEEDLEEIRDAEMTVMKESSRDVLSTRCQD